MLPRSQVGGFEFVPSQIGEVGKAEGVGEVLAIGGFDLLKAIKESRKAMAEFVRGGVMLVELVGEVNETMDEGRTSQDIEDGRIRERCGGRRGGGGE